MLSLGRYGWILGLWMKETDYLPENPWEIFEGV
jgi:hypothetical protein